MIANMATRRITINCMKGFNNPISAHLKLIALVWTKHGCAPGIPRLSRQAQRRKSRLALFKYWWRLDWQETWDADSPTLDGRLCHCGHTYRGHNNPFDNSDSYCQHCHCSMFTAVALPFFRWH
jgi:hypothetical protein